VKTEEKKMKKRNLLLGLLSILLVGIVLTACGDGGGGGPGDDGVTVLTFFHADGNLDMNFDDPVAQEITRRTGIRLEITSPMAGDESTDIALMVAQGEFPDLIYAKSSIDVLIGAGAVLRLDDLIAERGDNIRALYGDLLGRLRHTLDQPYTYHLGTFGVNQLITQTSGTAQIQMSAMRELGFPTLDSLEDFADAIRAYVEANPTINGQDTIGLSLLGSDWRWFITVGNPAGFALGYQDDGEWVINEETGEATFKYLIPEFREYFRWLNGMNAEGLLDPESFTHTPDTYFAKIASGRVVAVMDQNWNIGDTQTALRASGDEWREFMPLGVTLDPATVPMSTRAGGFLGGWGMSIAADSPNIDAAFDFMNWMASEEAQILLNWGIEGVHHEYVDGVRQFLPEVAEDRRTNPNFSMETGIGLYMDGFPQWGNAAVDSSGNPISSDNLDAMIEDFSDAQRETLAAFGAEIFVDLFPPSAALGVPRHGQAWALPIPSGSDLELIETRAIDFSQQAIVQAILADPADFDTAWDAVIQGLLDLGIEQANAEMTQIVQDTIRLWEDY